MIHELLNTALGPFKVKIWLAILAAISAIAGAFIIIADNRDKRMIETAQESGAVKAESAGKSVTLDQNRSANNAEDKVRRGGAAAVDGCVSDARGDSSGCERFRD